MVNIEIRGLILGKSVDTLQNILLNETEPICETIRVDASRQNVIVSVNNRNRKVFQGVILCLTNPAKIKTGITYALALRSETNPIPITGLQGEYLFLDSQKIVLKVTRQQF